MIRVTGEQVTVEDLGSANGTRVNDVATSGEVTLADGDILCFEKHCYGVALMGVPQDLDATIVDIDTDATVVAVPAREEPAPVSAPPPEPSSKPEPESAPIPEPVKADPSPAAADLPGSWVDGPEGGDNTRFLSMADIPDSGGDSSQLERSSDLAHLVVLNESGVPGEAIELQTTAGSDGDVWEIGRDESCQIMLSEASVSGRHAQLSHTDGRWKLVNLVSKNGIFVNGEKRLTAYLSDGDEIRLGRLNLVFRAAEGAAQMAPPRSSVTPAPASKAGEKQGGKHYMIIAGVVVVVLVGLWYFL